jgi:DNA-binding CsgD family transcriptional regulator
MVAASAPPLELAWRVQTELDALEQRLGADAMPAIAAEYMRRGIRGVVIAAPDGTELTDRERHVVIRYALGYRQRDIADELGLGLRTIETYLQRGQEKLRTTTRAATVRAVIALGWFRER